MTVSLLPSYAELPENSPSSLKNLRLDYTFENWSISSTARSSPAFFSSKSLRTGKYRRQVDEPSWPVAIFESGRILTYLPTNPVGCHPPLCATRFPLGVAALANGESRADVRSALSFRFHMGTSACRRDSSSFTMRSCAGGGVMDVACL